jgi:hypothetical protein
VASTLVKTARQLIKYILPIYSNSCSETGGGAGLLGCTGQNVNKDTFFPCNFATAVWVDRKYKVQQSLSRINCDKIVLPYFRFHSKTDDAVAIAWGLSCAVASRIKIKLGTFSMLENG